MKWVVFYAFVEAKFFQFCDCAAVKLHLAAREAGHCLAGSSRRSAFGGLASICPASYFETSLSHPGGEKSLALRSELEAHFWKAKMYGWYLKSYVERIE